MNIHSMELAEAVQPMNEQQIITRSIEVHRHAIAHADEAIRNNELGRDVRLRELASELDEARHTRDAAIAAANEAYAQAETAITEETERVSNQAATAIAGRQRIRAASIAALDALELGRPAENDGARRQQRISGPKK